MNGAAPTTDSRQAGAHALEILRAAMHAHALEDEFSYDIALVETANGRDDIEVYRVWFRYHGIVKQTLFRQFGAWKGAGGNAGAFMVPRVGERARGRTPDEVATELQQLLARHFRVILWTVRQTTRVERHNPTDPYVLQDAVPLLPQAVVITMNDFRGALTLRPKASLRILTPDRSDRFKSRFEPADGATFKTRYAYLLLQIVDTRSTWYAAYDVVAKTAAAIGAEKLPVTIRTYRDSFELARRPLAEPEVNHPDHHKSPVEHERAGHWRQLKDKRIWVSSTQVGGKNPSHHLDGATS